MTTTMNSGKITSASGYSSSFKPRKIVYQLPSNELPPSDSLASSHATTWLGLTPLEMIQKIASMTINSPAFCIETQGTQFQCGRLLIQSFLTDVPQQGMDVHAGQKRKRDGDDSIELDVDVDSLARVLESVDIRSSDYTFNRWTPTLPVGQSNLARLDMLVRELERLVVLSNIEWCLPSYNRVQRAFLSNIERAGGDPERRLIAVNNASCQMQALVDLVSSYPVSKSILPSPTKSADLSSKAIAGDMKARTAKFQNHMTVWIVNNWQNPFPDDDMFKYLANFMIDNQSVPLSSKDVTRLDGGESLFSITTEKIVNWLVNFRTRRWRPTIEQAFDLRRPASLLLEDSLRIFEGKDLRPLVEWNDAALFSFNPKYLTQLKTWKKNKGTHRIKKSEVTKLLCGRAGGKAIKQDGNIYLTSDENVLSAV